MKNQLLKLLVFCFVFAFYSNSQAQESVSPISDFQYLRGIGDYLQYANINTTNSPANVPYEDIKGSPYLFEEFEKGRIKLKDMKTFEGPLRYDIYANQFEFKTKEGEIYSITNPETIEKINIDNRIFVYVVNKEKPNTGSYYEVLADGEFSLLARHFVILKDPVPAKPYFDAKPAMFVTKDDNYYIENENSGLVEIKNKESVVGLDPDRADEISKFIKGNKIKMSNKPDLIKLTNFLNAD